jgi:hypothetical protein
MDVDYIWPVLLNQATHFAICIDVVDPAPERNHALEDRVLQNSARFHYEPWFVPILREHSHRGTNHRRFAAEPASLLVIDL